MSLNCTELRNMFEEKPRKGRVNHLDDYEYCRLLYETAKGNARRKSVERSKEEVMMMMKEEEENKYSDIRVFLREMEETGVIDQQPNSDFSFYSDPRRLSPTLPDFSFYSRRLSPLSPGLIEDFVAARRQQRVHSATNSDYR